MLHFACQIALSTRKRYWGYTRLLTYWNWTPLVSPTTRIAYVHITHSTPQINTNAFAIHIHYLRLSCIVDSVVQTPPLILLILCWRFQYTETLHIPIHHRYLSASIVLLIISVRWVMHQLVSTMRFAILVRLFKIALNTHAITFSIALDPRQITPQTL